MRYSFSAHMDLIYAQYSRSWDTRMYLRIIEKKVATSIFFKKGKNTHSDQYRHRLPCQDQENPLPYLFEGTIDLISFSAFQRAIKRPQRTTIGEKVFSYQIDSTDAHPDLSFSSASPLVAQYNRYLYLPK